MQVFAPTSLASGRANVPPEGTIGLACDLLRSTGHAALRTVKCCMVEDTLVLHGTVSSFYQKQLAQAVLLRDPAIPSVANQIEVRAVH
jgi:hypothetical protein